MRDTSATPCEDWKNYSVIDTSGSFWLPSIDYEKVKTLTEMINFWNFNQSSFNGPTNGCAWVYDATTKRINVIPRPGETNAGCNKSLRKNDQGDWEYSIDDGQTWDAYTT